MRYRKTTAPNNSPRWLPPLALLAMICFGTAAEPCEPDVYCLFREEARAVLDSLNENPTEANLVDRIILMHNLAFSRDKVMRQGAEDLLKEHFRDDPPLLMQAYAGSLQMIKVSHRSTGSKVFRSISPFSKSPIKEAREGFRKISEAMARDSNNVILRLLRTTAATESAEHLSELFDTARTDLAWLSANANRDDSVVVFLTELNWAKYYYKLSRENDDSDLLFPATEHINRAAACACTPVYRDRTEEWWSRIHIEIEAVEACRATDSLAASTPERSETIR